MRKFHSVMVLAAVAAGTLAPLVVGPAQAAPQRQSFTMPRAATKQADGSYSAWS